MGADRTGQSWRGPKTNRYSDHKSQPQPEGDTIGATREKRYKQRIAELEAENAALKKEVAELKAQVAKLKGKN